MNIIQYLKLLHEKTNLYMDVHRYSVSMYNGDPCHRPSYVQNYFQPEKVLHWTGNIPDMNLIANMQCSVINNVTENQIFSTTTLVETIKHACCTQICKTFCFSLIYGMPNTTAALNLVVSSMQFINARCVVLIISCVYGYLFMNSFSKLFKYLNIYLNCANHSEILVK